MRLRSVAAGTRGMGLKDTSRALPGRLMVVVVAVALVAAAAVVAVSADAAPRWPTRGGGRAPKFRDGTVLVGFDPSVTPAEQLRIMAAANARETGVLGAGAHL